MASRIDTGQSTREAVLIALKGAKGPVDGYAVAKSARVSPQQASRTMEKLVAEGLATKNDDIDGLSDPSATYLVA